MIPNEDVYADKDGKVTSDPSKYAAQIAVKGFLLDERVARRYGITDTLVSVDEPNALRRVVKIETEPEEKELEEQPELEEEKQEEPQKPAVTAESEPEAKEVEAEKSKASVTVKRAAAKKGEKKK